MTALTLILTIDRKLNDIWRVRQSRPLTQRVLVYWALLTLGPLLLAGSLTVTSYALTVSRGVVSALPGGVRLLLGAVMDMVTNNSRATQTWEEVVLRTTRSVSPATPLRVV